MRVLGVDPGTRATGYGFVERGRPSCRLIECGVVRPRAQDLNGRLLDIHNGMLELIDRLQPTCVAIEGTFTGRNARTALILGHARGVLVLAAVLRGIEVHEYAPREVKKRIVGTGAATKDQVGFMVKKHLSLREAPRPADAADGCAIALCHAIAALPAGLGARVPS